MYQDEIHGSLLSQAERTIDLIYTKYLKSIISYEGISRIETYPYPREAIRETVLNSIAHKNYATLIPIQIKIFSDKMVISNDCVFPEDWTMEDFLGKHRSRPYNPLIANTFYRAGYIESWGRGIQKIIEACRNSGNTVPSYQIKKDEITVVFKAKESFDKLLNHLQVYNSSRDNLLKIFDIYHDSSFFGRTDIMSAVGVNATNSGKLIAIESVSGHGKGKYRFKL